MIERAHAFPDALNLGGATADAALYRTQRLQALAARVLRHRPTLLTEVGEDGGSVELRQAVAKRALLAGVTLAPDDVLVTSAASKP